MRHLLPSTLATLLLAAASAAQTPADDPPAKIEALAARTLAQPGAVGLSIAVAQGDKVIYARCLGKADLETNFAGDKDTLFRIGSVTKQFTAAAVMKLVEQGKLSLDDTLTTLLPDFPATAKPVTLRQLLTHTSGVWSYTEDGKFMTREASLELTPAELIATFKDHPLDFDPGTKWHYSNSGYYLLGEIIARAAGKPYPAFLQDDLLHPLGLDRTRYDSNREVIPNRAQGYTLDHGAITNDRAIGADVPGAAGSLISSAESLVRWSLALASGKVISPASFDRMTTPAVLPDGTNTHYGFGLQVDEWEGHRRIAHGGGIFGFSSQLTSLPTDHLTIAVISNSEDVNVSKLTDGIARALLGIPEFIAADRDVPPTDRARFVGTYKFDDLPLELTIVDRDGKLWAVPTGQRETRLLYQGDREFRPDFDHAVRIVFPEGSSPADHLTLHQGGEHTAHRKN